jgi:hypothetical protein
MEVAHANRRSNRGLFPATQAPYGHMTQGMMSPRQERKFASPRPTITPPMAGAECSECISSTPPYALSKPDAKENRESRRATRETVPGASAIRAASPSPPSAVALATRPLFALLSDRDRLALHGIEQDQPTNRYMYTCTLLVLPWCTPFIPCTSLYRSVLGQNAGATDGDIENTPLQPNTHQKPSKQKPNTHTKRNGDKTNTANHSLHCTANKNHKNSGQENQPFTPITNPPLLFSPRHFSTTSLTPSLHCPAQSTNISCTACCDIAPYATFTATP